MQQPDTQQTEIDTNGMVLTFGKYKDELVRKVPTNYLRWLAIIKRDNPNHTLEGYAAHEVALHELERRGERLNSVEISLHAIDRFSTRHLRIWQNFANPDEGIAAFVERLFTLAVKRGSLMYQCRDTTVVSFHGVKWVFDHNAIRPVLITVE